MAMSGTRRGTDMTNTRAAMITAMLVGACGHGEGTGDFSSFGELEDAASTGEPAGTEHAGEDEGDKPDEPDDDRPDADSGEPPCGSSTKECDGDGGDDHDDPTSRPDDDGSGGDEDCCDADRTACTDAGTSVATCDDLHAMCESEDCTDLLTVCPLEGVPLSEACARMYFACHQFRPNKCKRESYYTCMGHLDDDPLCTAWDEECSDREEYCASLVDGLDGGDLEYQCTDWGHDFDPCWASYLACAGDAVTCEDELSSCVHDDEGNYYLTCFNTLDAFPDEGGGEGDDPDEPDSDEGGAEDGPPSP
jgi:hypothetical protein